MANAGSGKTTTLTARVLRLLLLGVAPEHIVCITYTKAAASEMRHRVLEGLRELMLAENDAICAQKIKKIWEISQQSEQKKPDFDKNFVTPELILRARRLFGSVLDSPTGGLQLTTIHGFCQNILRRFPIEAEIAPHFTVLEDAAAEELLARAKHALLTGIASADLWLTEALALIGARGGEFRFETLAADIISKRRLWDQFWRAQPPEVLKTRLWALHGLEEGLTQAMLEEAVVITPEEAATIRDYLPALLQHKTDSYRKFGEGLEKWLDNEAPSITARDSFISLFIKDDTERRVRLLNDKEYPCGHALREAIERIAERAERYAKRRAALACAEESFAVAVLARALLIQYAQAKEAMHALDYDDLIERTLRLCSNPETLGWVMSKLDHRIDHLLIDEAQDNSLMQWQLARVLVEELIAASGGIGNAGLPRSLLVVGDEKQSIYSFQGAEPQLFSAYRGQFTALLTGSDSPLTRTSLSNSYRSTAAVLRLVDHVCAQDAVKNAVCFDGALAPHQLIREAAAGKVVLYPPIVDREKETLEPLIIPTEYYIAANVAQRLADAIAETIAGWLGAGRLLVSEGRPVTAGDILILVHRRRPLVAPLIRALQRRNVAVAGLDRLVLGDHLAVRDLLALMRWCDHSADDLALAQVLRSPLIGMSDEELRSHAYNRPGTLWAQIDNAWLRDMQRARQMTPYDFLTLVLETSGGREKFARRFGAEVHEVLDELKAQAAAMPATMLPTLAQFHDWIAGSTRQIKREQEGGASNHVRIMTVHGAKGLEAPVVILADTVSVPTTAQEKIFVAESAHGQSLPVVNLSPLAKHARVREQARTRRAQQLLDEYYRLLYVALTRARDELHIFGSASKKGEVKADSWYAVAAASMRALEAQAEGECLVLQDQRPVVPARPAAVKAELRTLPAWAKAAAPRTIETAPSLAPSRLETSHISPYIQAAAGNARERGVRIHRVLELLQAGSDETAIARLVRYVAPEWSTAEQARAVKEIHALFMQEQWLWQGKRMPEVSITGMLAGRAVHGQMDALVITDEQAIILDYKTATKLPASPAEVSLTYLLQLRVYRDLVRQIYPKFTVRCAILWTAVPRLMWLDAEVEKAEFSEQNVMLKSPDAA